MEISPEMWISITSVLTAVGGAVGRGLHSRRVRELEREATDRETYWEGREDVLQARIVKLQRERDSLELQTEDVHVQ